MRKHWSTKKLGSSPNSPTYIVEPGFSEAPGAGWVYPTNGVTDNTTVRIGLKLMRVVFGAQENWRSHTNLFRRRFPTQDKAMRWVEKKVAQYLERIGRK